MNKNSEKTIIGVLIGRWIVAGEVPSIIYYGLGLLTPRIFLLVVMLICSVVSLATGTSWGTIGTIWYIALMGVGQGLGMPTALITGTIVSGAYFEDKMSSLSNTTSRALAVAGPMFLPM